MHKEIEYVQTDNYSVCIYAQRPGCATTQYVSECFMKIKGSVLYLVRRYIQRPCVEQVLTDCLRHGRRSPRPYKAGQACDGSISAPALHLYMQVCLAFGIPALDTYNEAYPDEPPLSVKDFRAILAFAEWQGVEKFERITPEALALVLESLQEINHSQLLSLLMDKIENSLETTGARSN